MAEHNKGKKGDGQPYSYTPITFKFTIIQAISNSTKQRERVTEFQNPIHNFKNMQHKATRKNNRNFIKPTILYKQSVSYTIFRSRTPLSNELRMNLGQKLEEQKGKTERKLT